MASTYLESLSKEELVNLLCQKDGKIAELEACILKLRFQLYGSTCERNLPSDPNAVQLTLDLFSDEENTQAQERRKKIEEEEANKVELSHREFAVQYCCLLQKNF